MGVSWAEAALTDSMRMLIQHTMQVLFPCVNIQRKDGLNVAFTNCKFILQTSQKYTMQRAYCEQGPK
jgi:hypothetical protein